MELCRICLSENTDKDVFSLPKELQVEKTVQEVMMFCLNIELCEDSKYDTFLCNNCHSSIISFYKFKVLALQSDEHLKSMRQCKTEDRKTDKLSYESGHEEVEVKQEIDELIVKCEKFDDDSDDNYIDEFTFEIEAPEENENATISLKKTRGCQIKSAKVEGSLKKECQVCGKNVKCLKQHMTYKHHVTLEGRPTCKICNKKVHDVIKHTNRHHNPLKTLPCEFCSDTFKNANGLDKHMFMHLTEKQFFCNDCDLGYYVKVALEMHIRRDHLKERFFKCSHAHCDQAFTRRYHLERHRLTHLNRTPSEKSDVCPICGKTYRQLKEHLLTHQPRSSRRLHKCKLCDKQYATRHGLRRHFNCTHNRKLSTCTVCHKEVAHLKSHTQRMHAARPFACSCCPATFAKASLLRLHLVTHSDERPFECAQCGNRFKSKNTLERHLKSIHVAEKRFFCEVCSKGFFSKNHLDRHQLAHSDVRKYKCEICQKSTKTASELRVHMDRHSGVKRFQCAVCGMGFVTHGGYSTHKLTHTKEKRHPCRFCDVRFGRSDHRNRHERTAHGKQLGSLKQGTDPKS